MSAGPANAPSSIDFEVQRQERPGAAPYWEYFRIPYRARANVISCLMEIQRTRKNRDGKDVAPVAWDCNCLEEVCGACSMVINGRARQACSALIDPLLEETQGAPIKLQPMSKFPCVRDLMVDRSKMFEDLKRVKAWVTIDGTHDLGPGPRMNDKDVQRAYIDSRCMTCGCCLEACPQINAKSDFMGAHVFGQVRRFNVHPTGAMHAEERLDSVMGAGGIADCGNAQNCVMVCPKEIPLTEDIASVGRQTTVHAFKKLFGGS